jgi:hypothetical protein
MPDSFNVTHRDVISLPQPSTVCPYDELIE